MEKGKKQWKEREDNEKDVNVENEKVTMGMQERDKINAIHNLTEIRFSDR